MSSSFRIIIIIFVNIAQLCLELIIQFFIKKKSVKKLIWIEEINNIPRTNKKNL